MPSKLAAAVYALGLGCMAGCGSGTRYYTDPTVLAADSATVNFSGTLYHAYGDSITVGFTVDPATQAYPALLARDRGLTLTNSAISGRMACDVSGQEIFPANDTPTLNDGTLRTLLISSNDINNKGAGAYESTFRLCHLAAAAWLAVPEEYKVRATASSVILHGNTIVDPVGNFHTVITQAQGTTISFPMTLAAAGPVYLWYHSLDLVTGTFAVAVDGVDQLQVATAASPAIATGVGAQDSLAMVRLPAVPAGNHTLTVRQTSTGGNAAWIEAIGIPPAVPAAGMPLLLIGTTPKYLAGSGYECAISDAPCQAYITDIEQTVSTLAGDHLNVLLFDARKYESGTSADMSDAVHPNVLGQQELEHVLTDILH